MPFTRKMTENLFDYCRLNVEMFNKIINALNISARPRIKII